MEGWCGNPNREEVYEIFCIVENKFHRIKEPPPEYLRSNWALTEGLQSGEHVLREDIIVGALK